MRLLCAQLAKARAFCPGMTAFQHIIRNQEVTALQLSAAGTAVCCQDKRKVTPPSQTLTKEKLRKNELHSSCTAVHTMDMEKVVSWLGATTAHRCSTCTFAATQT